MSIPKIIHYCWFGNGKKSKLMEKCIKSWQRYCPEYEIICWSEDNFDVNSNLYVKQAYQAQKWAFVTDYVRLRVLYENGGVYFDTDVELIKPIDSLIENNGFVGFEPSGNMSTGLGFACEKGNALIKALLDDYNDIPFVLEDGSFDLTPCPVRNAETLKKLGFDTNNKNQIFMGIHFYPEEYFCPINYYTGKKRITKNTYSIHHYCASWTSKTAKRTTFVKRLVGVKMYDKLYGKFLHKFKWLEW